MVEQAIDVHASRGKSQVTSLDAEDENGMSVLDHLCEPEPGLKPSSVMGTCTMP